MPAKDRYHGQVVRALKKEAGLFTDDPLTLALFGTGLLIDLGAERALAAERGWRRNAVEIESFLKPPAVQNSEGGGGIVRALRAGAQAHPCERGPPPVSAGFRDGVAGGL